VKFFLIFLINRVIPNLKLTCSACNFLCSLASITNGAVLRVKKGKKNVFKALKILNELETSKEHQFFLFFIIKWGKGASGSKEHQLLLHQYMLFLPRTYLKSSMIDRSS
jgi:hypothetical protein